MTIHRLGLRARLAFSQGSTKPQASSAPVLDRAEAQLPQKAPHRASRRENDRSRLLSIACKAPSKKPPLREDFESNGQFDEEMANDEVDRRLLEERRA